MTSRPFQWHGEARKRPPEGLLLATMIGVDGTLAFAVFRLGSTMWVGPRRGDRMAV